MAIPTVYRWDDGNAPIARGERRSLCDILHACLVTGYGDKPGAGWVREFVNPTFNKAVFRNNPVTGTGFFIVVDGLTTTNAWESKIVGFEMMGDIDNGIYPFTTTINLCETSMTANTVAHPWVLIADDRAFRFICWNGITTAPTQTTLFVSSMFFGDGVPINRNDGFFCLFTGGPNVNGSGGAGGVLISGSSTGTPANLARGYASPRKSTGEPYSTTIQALITGGGPCDAPGYGMGLYGMTRVAGLPTLINRPFINEEAAYTCRGFVPGLYAPCHPWSSFGQLETITVYDKTLLSILHYGAGGNNGYRSNYFISLDDWWI